ncbi:MAG: anion transporter [Chloroflexi bacterium CFX4]|nr:anion transporter [Chloroflexi bacterium CFX4]MDL1923319.1 anion transporter [Chloroflexi bacterium CFX3]
MPDGIAAPLSVLVILLTYAGVAIGQLPRLRMNRATIAIVGAAALLALGAISEQQAYDALDIGTLMLLFGMMVINVNLRMAGFFGLVGAAALRLAKTPHALLALIVVAAGVLSALFLNDTICLMLTPLVVTLTRRLKRDPIPYLIGLAAATNIGSVATITGNPQNLIIGQSSGIPYLTFLLSLAPIALVGMVIIWLVIVWLYRAEFRGRLGTADMPTVRTYQPLLSRCLLVMLGLMFAFLFGLPIAPSAFIAASLLLVSRLRPHKLMSLDWELLAFFSGLFIVTHAIEVSGLGAALFEATAPILRGGIAQLSLITAALSNVVSNVPAVLLLRPEMAQFPNPQQAWLTLAMASTLAGNFTLLGSVANLIVAGIAARMGVRLTFGAYLRAGVPITILSILFGIVWLMWVG